MLPWPVFSIWKGHIGRRIFHDIDRTGMAVSFFMKPSPRAIFYNEVKLFRSWLGRHIDKSQINITTRFNKDGFPLTVDKNILLEMLPTVWEYHLWREYITNMNIIVLKKIIISTGMLLTVHTLGIKFKLV